MLAGTRKSAKVGRIRRHLLPASRMDRGVSRAAIGIAVCAGFVAASLVTLGAPSAEAKATYESPYGYERTWNAALRLVRVDNGWKVTEKDESSGYLLFDYRSPESAKASPGSVELVRGGDGNGPVSVLVELAQMPHYHEQLMLDALASKMRREYGEPPVRPKREPAVPDSPDAGLDDGA
jgi:hypothetical protein